MFILCFFYGMITRCALSGMNLFSLVHSYLITFKFSNVAYCLPLFQLLDSSSLLVSSDVQGLLSLQKQIPDEHPMPFENIRITQ